MATRKKARSAKQKANDKRLGQMAKARHAAKRAHHPLGMAGVQLGMPAKRAKKRRAKKGTPAFSLYTSSYATHRRSATKPKKKRAARRGKARTRASANQGTVVPVLTAGGVREGHIARGKARTKALGKLSRTAMPSGSKSARIARKALMRKGNAPIITLPGYMRRKRKKK